MNILPFAYIDGVPTFKNSELVEIFQKLTAQRLRREIFFDRFMTGADFIQLVKSVPYFFALLDGQDIVGFAYLTNNKGTSAHIHVVYFNDGLSVLLL